MKEKTVENSGNFSLCFGNRERQSMLTPGQQWSQGLAACWFLLAKAIDLTGGREVALL